MSSDVTSPISLSHFAPTPENQDPNAPAATSTTQAPASLLHSTAEPVTTTNGQMPRAASPSRLAKEDMKNPSMKLMVGIGVCVVVAGIATGWGITRLRAGNQLFSSSTPGGQGPGGTITAVPEGRISVGQVFGSEKTDIFKDTTEGVLQIGGIDGEGTHKLLRPGGASQTVFMTSSVTDLDKFENAKVKVWGQTLKAEKAGWLMDVGRIEVVELNAKAP